MKNKAKVLAGRKGGLARSRKKRLAAKRNGMNGGRPKDKNANRTLQRTT